MIDSLKKLTQLLGQRDLKWLIVLLACILVAVGLEIVSISAVPVVISVIINPQLLADYPLGESLVSLIGEVPRREMIVWAGFAFVFIFMIRTAFLVFNRYLQARFSVNRQVSLSSRLLDAYMHAVYDFHLEQNSSELIRNIQSGAIRIGGEVISQLLAVAQHLIILTAIIALLFIAQPQVALFSFMIFGIFGGVFVKFTSSRVRALGAGEMTARREALHLLRQSLEGYREIWLLGAQEPFVKRFYDISRQMGHAQLMRTLFSYISSPLLETLAIITLFVIAGSLIVTEVDPVIVIAQLGLFGMAFMRMKGSLSSLLSAHTSLRYHLVNVDHIHEHLSILKDRRQFESGSQSGKKMPFTREVELKNVFYQYPGASEPALKDVSMVIPHGAKIGIVGQTGAGKSTLVDIILGILKPIQGEVLVDGVDVHSNLNGWKQDIGYVPQLHFLTDDTIRRNVAMGIQDHDIDDDEVIRAIEDAQLQEYVDKLPDGLNTVVGERGYKLSGGQRQRIIIARALYKRPKILIFDEATSSLDALTETRVITSLLNKKDDITIIMITHRFDNLKNFDCIYEICDRSIRKKY